MHEMTIQLQTEGKLCLYEQIYEYIKNEIKSGKLLAGERLPSTRSLAEYLQVARSTVDYAYGQLLSEGYIESRPCKGHFVCSMEEMFRLEAESAGRALYPAKESAAIKRRITDGSASGKAGEAFPKDTEDSLCEGGLSKVTESLGGRMKKPLEEHCRIDFSPFDIDMSGFPFGVWKKITKNILNYANSELFARGEEQGDYDFRRTISRYLHSSRGVNCRPEQIIVGAGNDYLLFLLEKILGPRVRIAMENPTYKRSYRIFQSFSYTIATVDMDEWGMRADKLEQESVSAVYVMPSHQFPTGTVMPIGRRMELLKWAGREPGRYLIEDDYDSEFRYHGKPIPALQASDKHGRVIYMGTFSKAIAPAIRISFMVLPESLLEKYLRDCAFYSCTVSRIDQSILNEFIQEGCFERHLNKMRKIYRAKHELLLECLQPFRTAFEISGENAGLHLLLTSKTGISEKELIRRAMEGRVRVYGLSENMVETASDSRTVLIGFGGVSADEIREGMELLEKAWIKQ